MSSTAVATVTATDTLQTLTYWCHECDMSVSLLSPPPPPRSHSRSSPPPPCPHCSSLLELMDFSSPTTNNASNANTNTSSPHFDCRPSITFSLPSSSSDSEDEEDDRDDFVVQTVEHTAPAFSLIETIPTIKFSTLLLDLEDPPLLCPICKDQFALDVEVKQLPCKHFYHFDCIAPWLAHHYTCPVCRFCLPIATRSHPQTPAAVELDDVAVLATSLPSYLR